MADELLLVDDADGVRTITINRPEAKNALTLAMRLGLCELLGEAEQSPELRAVVIAAADPVFSAGVDFKEVASGDAAKPWNPFEAQFNINPGKVLRAMTTPVVCAVNGACVSGGLEIALSSSFVVASDKARFADTHARLGVVATWGLTALLPRAVGIRKAREMSITGNFVDADEALRIGLANHVVPHDELRDRAVALARDISPNPAVHEVLRLYNRGDGLSLADALAMERDWTSHRTSHDPDAFRRLGEETARRQK